MSVRRIFNLLVVLLFVVLVSFFNSVYGQVSGQSMSRAEYLIKVEEMAKLGQNFEDSPILISDLQYSNWREWYQRADNPILVPAGKFYSFNQERRIHILRNPSQYIITPDEEFPLRFPISRMVFDNMPIEKKEALIRDFRVEIKD
jgi:hypothetical protein